MLFDIQISSVCEIAHSIILVFEQISYVWRYEIINICYKCSNRIVMLFDIKISSVCEIAYPIILVFAQISYFWRCEIINIYFILAMFQYQ